MKPTTTDRDEPTTAAEQSEALSANVIAGLLLTVRPYLPQCGLRAPSTQEMLQATGAGRTRAYQLAKQIQDSLAELSRPAGRPSKPPQSPPANSECETLCRKVRDYVMDHPGCVSSGGQRREYSDDFRRFIVKQRQQSPTLSIAVFAEACGLPKATVAEWLCKVERDSALPTVPSGPASATEVESETPTQVEASQTQQLRHVYVQTILQAWSTWHGSFQAFCAHVATEHRLPCGQTFISSVLENHGERIPRRRPGRSPDEKAWRDAFTTYFPSAQWVDDGMQVPITLDGVTYTFNLELHVDASSGALVGMVLSDEEDSQAVIDAFYDGVKATGTPPLSLLLDNRESNHTSNVEDALGEQTRKIRATIGRPQNKGHVEGAFGLFRQTAPHLAFAAAQSRELARQVLQAIIQVWARTLNYKPRRTKGGLSRIQLYQQDPPTPEQVQAARQALDQLARRQQLAFETREARQDAAKCQLLSEQFERLQLSDPTGHLLSSIARYPWDDIIEGISIFEGKRQNGTLPSDLTADAQSRYLLGIVRNVAHNPPASVFASHPP